MDYVTDTAYPAGYYREQSPAQMRLACLLAGMAPGTLDGANPTYLELGCGTGFTAMALAASNPHWQVIGIDLMPEHIAAAQAFAAEAGLANVMFLQGDLSTFAESADARALPAADVVSLHGLWSWVPDAVRAGVVRLLDMVLRPGGMVQVSYNSLPGWQGAMGLQRTIREIGLHSSGNSTQQALSGLQTVFQLMGANAMHIAAQPFVQAMLHALQTSSVDYLAHEYMNGAWSPCFHADVARALAPAGLHWAASTTPMENLTALTLLPAQRAIFEAQPDPLARELIRDMCLFRGFRSDVFIRGTTELGAGLQKSALSETLLLARAAPESFSLAQFIPRPNLPRSPIMLNRAVFEPVLAALENGPCAIGQLANLPSTRQHADAMLMPKDTEAELAAFLVGSNHAIPVTAAPSAANATTIRFNQTAARHMAQAKKPQDGIALAVTGTGTPLPCTVLQALIWDRLHQGAPANPHSLAESASHHPLIAENPNLTAQIQDILAHDPAIWTAAGLL